jgi:beta-glucosidase
VAATAAGDWVSFADAALPGRHTALTARVANPGTTPRHVTVRLDDPNHGPVLGTLTVPGNGDRYAYTTASTPLTGGHAGKHTVYLVFDGPAELFTFQLTHGR